MKIGLAGDHAGYCLKDKIREVIEKLGHEPIDFGTGSGEPVDYPDYALILCEAILEKQADMGILCCGTGLGMAISANKVPGIRAVTCSDTFSARASREHNDANVLCLGARVVGEGLASDIARVWLEAKFQGGRHQARVSKIRDIERTYFKEC